MSPPPPIAGATLLGFDRIIEAALVDASPV
jgi:hypothetical protein